MGVLEALGSTQHGHKVFKKYFKLRKFCVLERKLIKNVLRNKNNKMSYYKKEAIIEKIF